MGTGILWLSLTAQSIAAVKAAVNYEFSTEVGHYHVTIKFGVELTPELERLLGQEVTIAVMLSHYNSRVQALSVELPDEWQELSGNTHPHVTLCMLEGVQPFESNAMLRESNYSDWVLMHIVTVVEFFEFPSVV